jgi:hypothetical protein
MMMKPSEIAYAIEQTFNKNISKYAKIASLGNFYIRPNPKGDKVKLEKTLIWINNFVKNEVKDLADAWALVPEELWRNYQLLDLDELAECKILKKAKRDFINRWKKRPHTIRQTHPSNELKEVKIEEIVAEEFVQTNQFDTLVKSIKESGLQAPIIITPYKNKFMIIDGQQRYYACKLLGHEKISCIIKLENYNG